MRKISIVLCSMFSRASGCIAGRGEGSPSFWGRNAEAEMPFDERTVEIPKSVSGRTHCFRFSRVAATGVVLSLFLDNMCHMFLDI